MTDWQITLVTIFCEAVQDEVTISVRNDWSFKCTGYPKSSKTDGAGASANSTTGKASQQQRCEVLECSRVIQYREKLRAEEAIKGQTITHGELPVSVKRPDGSEQR